MTKLLLDQPAPDFDELVGVLKGERPPQRVYLVEAGIDPEVLQTIQNYAILLEEAHQWKV